ncbi:MAG: hypothetical protein H6659_04315 [Ardenticatenaceae bacterium]|nr:hypothetical protein [Ardenticatenaceae bacterium]MCB8987626.1 hypothetical protein [Ardenticatenaceae bacterium]
MNQPPLIIHFGDQAASLQCDDPELAAYLSEMFQHSLDGRLSPRTAYQISGPVDGRFTLSRDKQILQTTPTAPALLPWLMQDLVSALIEAQTEHLIFHAGGVLVDNVGIFLGGQTGSGKSTLTACLLANGADYLSDEVLALSPATPPTMVGLVRPLVLKEALPPAWAPWLPDPTSSPLAAMTDGTHWILPAWMGAAVAAGPVPLGLLLFPTYRAAAPLAIRPLSTAEAAFQLLQNLVNARNLPDKGVSAAAEIARRVPAYQITYDEATAVAAWIHDNLHLP